MDRLIKLIKNPLWIIIFFDRLGLHFLSDKKYISLLYKLTFKKKLDLNNPQTFNEKLQWLKLNDRKEEYTKMVDKFDVKQIVSKKIGEKYIIPTYGIYNNFEEIDFSILPKQFIIKPTHYGGNNGITIVNDKDELNKARLRKQLNKIMKKNLYYYGREWPYKNVKPRIIIEHLLKNDDDSQLCDYKFYCFNGKVYLWFIASDRKNNVKFTFFDRTGNFLDIKQCGAPNDRNVKKPKNLEKMIELAEILAKNITQVRIDFYEVNNKIYFGEMTFFDTSGFGKFEPDYWDKKIGDMIKLPIENKKV
jgi:hypothetical protein